jgi:hypothetical protein
MRFLRGVGDRASDVIATGTPACMTHDGEQYSIQNFPKVQGAAELD